MYRKKYEIVKTLKKRLKNDSPMIRPSFSPPVNSAGRGKDDLIATDMVKKFPNVPKFNFVLLI